ncbi:MAG: response regulator [Myxococcota bacterium]
MDRQHPNSDQVRLLLVEDNPGDAELIGVLLESVTETAYHITCVSTLAAAEQSLGDGQADLVLLDLGLPDASGEQVIRQVRAADVYIPIVVLTGHDSDRVQMASIRAGADDFISKHGLTGGELTRCITNAIERNRVQLQLRALLSELADAVVIVGDDRRIHFANPAAVQIFGPVSPN